MVVFRSPMVMRAVSAERLEPLHELEEALRTPPSPRSRSSAITARRMRAVAGDGLDDLAFLAAFLDGEIGRRQVGNGRAVPSVTVT